MTQAVEVKDLTPEQLVLQKKLVKILDFRLLVWSFFAYFCNGLDRNNMPYAYTSGMPEDLGLVKDQYNWAVTMFFIGYVILQIPSNAIITRVRPSIMLPTITFLWGAVVSFMSLVKNPQGLYGLRITLGFSEAAFYPGIVYLLGSWYTKEELGARTAIFVAGSQLSGAFSGLISGAISQTLHGQNGMSGWKWLFIIEGVIAMFVALFGFFLLPDMPANTRFLSPELRELAVYRLQRQGRQTNITGFNWVTFRNLFSSPYILIYIIVFSIMQIGMQMLTQFPIILKTMGYDTTWASYMNAPVWVVAAIVIIAQGYLSDWKGARVWHVVGGAIITIVFYIILVAVNGGEVSTTLLFVCVYFITPVLGISPIFMTWLNEFYSVDVETRALAIATVNSIGNLAPNFANVKIWLVSDAPAFRNGKIITMSLMILLVILVIAMHYCQQAGLWLPKRSDKIETDSTVSNMDKPHEADETV
ncbi:MFS general substrate transporter [Hesseltinella vesiculosa]|uniref:MFS general substrate transporter n=1 Tax=Hesseltinella vesiculosa TaxID=101127 RepID=A0A1X2GU63_9FUNG|nr:MFS general substrate transporter [Hesseltinella vesiculosa]